MTLKEQYDFKHSFAAAYLARWYYDTEQEARMSGKFYLLNDPPLEDMELATKDMWSAYETFSKRIKCD